MKGIRNIKFFIVFNDSFSRMLYHQYLVRLGFRNNILIESGEDCIKKLDLQPDIIFIAYEMDAMNGVAVLQQVKLQLPDTHVIIIACPNNKLAKKEALNNGASAYITKGENDLDMLRKAVENILAAKPKQQQTENA